MLVTEAKNQILNHGIDANYILFGDGITSASLTDEKLEDEVLRIPVFSSRYENKLYFTAIFSEQMGVDSYTEIGIVRNGKLTKDTGSLLSRILSNFTKQIDTAYLYRYIFTFTGFTDIQ